MVSISNWLTLGLIGGGILAFYKLGGASGIGSKIGGGFSSLFDSFTSSIFPVSDAVGRLAENIQNPALNPVLVAATELEAAITKDPNTEKGKFEPPLGSPEYDPYDPYKITSDNTTLPKIFETPGIDLVTTAPPPAPVIQPNTGGSVGGITDGGTRRTSTGGRSPGAAVSGRRSSPAASSSSTGGSNSGGSSGSQTGGSTGSSQPSSRRGTYSGGRR